MSLSKVCGLVGPMSLSKVCGLVGQWSRTDGYNRVIELLNSRLRIGAAALRRLEADVSRLEAERSRRDADPAGYTAPDDIAYLTGALRRVFGAGDSDRVGEAIDVMLLLAEKRLTREVEAGAVISLHERKRAFECYFGEGGIFDHRRDDSPVVAVDDSGVLGILDVRPGAVKTLKIFDDVGALVDWAAAEVKKSQSQS